MNYFCFQPFMRMLRKFTLKYFLAGILTSFIFCTLTWKTAQAYSPSHDFYSVLTTAQDTIKPVNQNDSLRNRNKIPGDSSRKSLVDTIPPKNRVDTFEYKLSKDSLDAPVHYQAEDSVVVLVQQKKIVLYGKTKTEYKDIVLTAPKTELD